MFFILPDLESEGVDAVEADGIPPMSRQKLMKDLKIIELLTDIIYYPFKNEIVALKLLTKDEPQQLRVSSTFFPFSSHFQDFITMLPSHQTHHQGIPPK